MAMAEKRVEAEPLTHHIHKEVKKYNMDSQQSQRWPKAFQSGPNYEKCWDRARNLQEAGVDAIRNVVYLYTGGQEQQESEHTEHIP